MKNRTKQQIKTRDLFHRHRPAPLAVQDKAGLWLDLYVEFATALVANREGVSSDWVVGMAEDLANRSLDAYEGRWPTALVPRS